MKTTHKALAFLLAGSLGLACGGNGLTSGGRGGQSGSGGLGGAVGSGGTKTGGFGGSAAGGGGVKASGGSIGSGGRVSSEGGSKAGGSGGTGAGGASVGFGGQGGTGAGGVSGTGGTTCPPMGVCPAIACLYGEMPNPDPCGCPICAPPEAGACLHSCPAAKCAPGSVLGADACGCPICISPDAGAGNDAASDACIIPPCLPPEPCGPGFELVQVLCGCPTCMAVDAGRPDGIIVCPLTCSAIDCAPGDVPGTDVCGCPTCAPVPDAGPDAGQPACVGLDECTCAATAGCSVLAGACYCPFPQCGSGACFCGGGPYIGCSPVELASCDSAKARVATLCPDLKGATFDNLCAQSDADCITECLNEVTSCSDVFCAFCEGCDCATDRFSMCVGSCKTAVAP